MSIRTGDAASAETPDMDGASAIAAWLGIDIPAACRAGVVTNLAILTRHMAVVQRAAAEAPPDPAELLQP